jgi:hypothetical protein
MIRFLFTIAIVLFMLSCSQNQSASGTAGDSTQMAKADTTSYAYKAGYSSSFDIGKPEASKTVLAIWKSYENNKLADSKDLWSDSVTLQFENFTFHGSRDSAIAGGIADRAQFTSVIDSVDAWVPLHSNDRNADWVAVWAREFTVDKKGKKDTADIHEIWQLKDGKARFMSQYRSHRRP